MGAFCAAMLLLAVSYMMPELAHAHDTKSMGQKVYIPVYSSISHASDKEFDLKVTLSFRNLDGAIPITLISAIYYDTVGNELGNLLKYPSTLAPFGTTQIFLETDDFRGDVGANIVIEWSSQLPVTLPLIETIMVGYRGTQAFAFTSRGIVID